jgi:Domain of unknown function (DUF4388)
VALQGTLDDFDLADVLRLIESTGKSGRLRVIGQGGSGSIWVEGGEVMASDGGSAVPPGDHVGALFELLRLDSGEFLFAAGEVPGETLNPITVGRLVNEAEAFVEEWVEIEKVVPSLEAWVSLQPELPEDEVIIERADWKVVAFVGDGTTVASLGAELQLSQVPVGRFVKGLVEKGILKAETERPAGARAVTSGRVARKEAAMVDTRNRAFKASIADDPAAGGAAPLPADPEAAADEEADPVVAETEEPAVAADPESPVEDEAVVGPTPTEGVDPEDELNRGTLLKFLSSVRS